MKPPQIRKQVFSPIEHDVLEAFSTPFLKGRMRLNHDMVKSDIEKLHASINQEDGNERNYTSYFYEESRQELSRCSWYEDFANQCIDTYIHFIASFYGTDPRQLNRKDIHFFAWSNLYKGQHYHEVHNHPDSKISGTYYVDVNQNTAPIRFISPVSNIYSVAGDQSGFDHPHHRDIKCIGGSPLNISEMVFQPKVGDCYFWPSYLYHGVPHNGDQEQRISISFNLDHNRPLSDTHHGSSMNYDFL